MKATTTTSFVPRDLLIHMQPNNHSILERPLKQQNQNPQKTMIIGSRMRKTVKLGTTPTMPMSPKREMLQKKLIQRKKRLSKNARQQVKKLVLNELNKLNNEYMRMWTMKKDQF